MSATGVSYVFTYMLLHNYITFVLLYMCTDRYQCKCVY